MFSRAVSWTVKKLVVTYHEAEHRFAPHLHGTNVQEVDGERHAAHRHLLVEHEALVVAEDETGDQEPQHETRLDPAHWGVRRHWWGRWRWGNWGNIVVSQYISVKMNINKQLPVMD